MEALAASEGVGGPLHKRQLIALVSVEVFAADLQAVPLVLAAGELAARVPVQAAGAVRDVGDQRVERAGGSVGRTSSNSP